MQTTESRKCRGGAGQRREAGARARLMEQLCRKRERGVMGMMAEGSEGGRVRSVLAWPGRLHVFSLGKWSALLSTVWEPCIGVLAGGVQMGEGKLTFLNVFHVPHITLNSCLGIPAFALMQSDETLF